MTKFEATKEQQAILDADPVSLAVVACPGSGKTATAVRRLAELRRRLEGTRGQVALLSYSNVAVETFREEYRKLRSRSDAADGVIIQTVDSFLTTYLLRPHAARMMKATRTPFLVTGGEAFLSNYKFGDVKKPGWLEDVVLARENGKTVFYKKLKSGSAVRLSEGDAKAAAYQAKELAKVGGYTYALGRAWARMLLEKEPRLAAALARRFPQILVDEAQDIGSFEGEILDMLMAAGSVVSLIGDFHQSIYGFNFATGAYLRDFSSRLGVLQRPLTENRRSLPSIVNAANLLASTTAKPCRKTAERLNGAYYLRYDVGQLPHLMSTWATLLVTEKYSLDESVVLCRGGSLLSKLASGAEEVGQSAVRHFAAAAIEREQRGDVSRAFEHCAKGVLHLIAGLPLSFVQEIKRMGGDANLRMLRRHMWALVRSPDTGIPSATLAAKTSWQPALKENIEAWLGRVESSTTYQRVATWNSRVTKAELPDLGPLTVVDFGQNDWAGLRRGTVHSAKGEGIPAVMYLTTDKDLKAMLAGTDDEEGRIGYVAVTRARDLLVVAISKKANAATLAQLAAKGFTEWSIGKAVQVAQTS